SISPRWVAFLRFWRLASGLIACSVRRSTMHRTLFLVVALVMSFTSPTFAQTNQATNIAKVLSTADLWGKDFPGALVSLQAWARSGEASVVIFPDRLLGGTRLTVPEAAKSLQLNLASNLLTLRPEAKSEFHAVMKELASQRIEVGPRLIRFREDD